MPLKSRKKSSMEPSESESRPKRGMPSRIGFHMGPSVQNQLETCMMCGFPVDVQIDPHISGNPAYRTKKTECSNPECKCRMYELKKLATPAEDEDVPIPHLKAHINEFKCQKCETRTNKLWTGKTCLCCEECYKG